MVHSADGLLDGMEGNFVVLVGNAETHREGLRYVSDLLEDDLLVLE